MTVDNRTVNYALTLPHRDNDPYAVDVQRIADALSAIDLIIKQLSDTAATADDVDTRLQELIGAAPAALDTLVELAAALGDDPNLSATLTARISEKASLSGAAFTGSVSFAAAATFTSSIYLNRDSGDATINMYDSANAAWRQFGWDQSSGEFRAEADDNAWYTVWTAKNFTPANYAALEGATFSGPVTVNGLLSSPSAEAFRAGYGVDGEVYMSFYNQNSRRGYIQSHGNGFRLFNDVTNDYLQLNNTNIINALQFYDSSLMSLNTVWHSGNDGPGSGLDADMLDGQHASAFLSGVYESGEIAITSAGTVTLSHGLGAAPRFLQFFLICKTAQGGFSVGDVIVASDHFQYHGGVAGLVAKVTSTQITLRYGSHSSPFDVIDISSGSQLYLDNAKWRLLIKAIK